MSWFNSAYVIAKKDTLRTFKSPLIYVIMVFSVLLYFLYYSGLVKLADNPLQPIPEHLIALSGFYVVSLFIPSLYFAISSVTTVSREKEDNTIEVLRYGPVSEGNFLAGKFISRFIVALVINGILLGMLVGVDVINQESFNIFLNDIEVGLIILLFHSSIIANGIFFSSLTSRVAFSIFLLIFFYISMFVLGGLNGIAGYIVDNFPDASVFYSVASTYQLFYNAIKFALPAEYLSLSMSSFEDGFSAYKYAVGVVSTLIYISFSLLLAWAVMKTKNLLN